MKMASGTSTELLQKFCRTSVEPATSAEVPLQLPLHFGGTSVEAGRGSGRSVEAGHLVFVDSGSLVEPGDLVVLGSGS